MRKDERARASHLFGYIALLNEAGRKAEGAELLRREVESSRDPNFLERARGELSAIDDTAGERLALKKLTEVSPSPRSLISYRLQLAESYRAAGETAAAATVLAELRTRYPTNYGVLSEAANFYWRMGQRAEAVGVLRDGMTRGRGRFHYIFARKLAARELDLNHTVEAERVLRALHDENKLNTEVCHELARLYIRTGQRAELHEVFQATLAAIKDQDLEVKELQAQVADLRAQMIEAFTRLKDYRAAVEQHIEIINRDPDDEANVDAALAYVKRYGGADTLLAYYQKTAQQAYKNYRWNVVLARIHEAAHDYGAAAADYRAALENQPEMLELHAALADACKQGKDYDGALAALARAAELSNDDPQYVRQTVALLEQLGRKREADIARQKLPPAPQPILRTTADQFAEAARLRHGEQDKSVAAYRQAFDSFTAAPYQTTLRAEDINSYVRAVRAEETLDQIATRLWQLRARFSADADGSDEKLALKARERLQVLDGALPEALGAWAGERGTGDELAALWRDWQTRADETLQRGHDPHGTLALLQNLSRRAGFDPLAERILRAQKDAAFTTGNTTEYHARMRALVDLYNAAGAYDQIVELLDAEQARDAARGDFNYQPLIADYARATGDRTRELTALRAYYEQTGNKRPADQPLTSDELITRYFAALLEGGAAGRAELRQRIKRPDAHHVQLINFLLAAHEGALAHEAITRAPLALAWQLARNAEASLALAEYDADREQYFVAALQFKPIGELVAARPDASRQLVGDDWFNLAARYGQWLYQTNQPAQRAQSRALLPAQIENRPHDADAQAQLGRWYLAQHDAEQARAHLQLALAARADDRALKADLGTVYFMLGDHERAHAVWQQIIAGDDVTQRCPRALLAHARRARACRGSARAVVAYLSCAA